MLVGMMSFEDILFKVIHYNIYNDHQKKVFIAKLIQHTSNKELSYGVVASNFSTCLSCALECSSNSATGLALYCFSVWGNNHKSYLKEYLNLEYVSSVFNESDHFKMIIILKWFKEALQILKKDHDYIESISPIMSSILENKLEEHGQQSAFLSHLSEIYLLCPSLLPLQHLRLNFTILIMKYVASFPTPTKPETLKNMKSVGQLVTMLWESLHLEDILSTLIAMYNMISNTDPSAEVCPAMAHLLSMILPQVVEALSPRIVSEPSSNNASFLATLNRLCCWLVAWPTAHETLVHWIRTLVRLLYQNDRDIVPCRITYEQVPKLLEALRIPVCRAGVCSVITVLLMSFQLSAVAFHKVIPQLIRIIEYLENESTEASRETLSSLSILCHAQMALFPGHPETYQNLMDILYKYPMPSDEEIKVLIEEHFWTSHLKDNNGRIVNSARGLNKILGSSNTYLFSPSYHKRSSGQRVGLRNLGNTCYMNSVIQALFMTDDFRHTILHAVPKANQYLLVKLQHLFTSLCFSDRSYVSPVTFHEKSRPSWFHPGMQQDCSEYLRHLMITLHEEERSGQKLPEYQERVIIESETASIASDIQTNSDDPYQIQDIDDTEMEKENKVSHSDSNHAVDYNSSNITVNNHEEEVILVNSNSENKWKPKPKEIYSQSNNSTKSVPNINEKANSESGSFKRKHNVSPVSSHSPCVKSPKGENSTSLTSDIDNSSDSGISGDLAEDIDFIPLSSPLSCQKENLPLSDKGIQMEEVTTDNDYFVSQVHRLFGGKIATCIKCLKCKTESIHRDIFTDINLTFQDSDQYNSTSAIRKQPERLCKQKQGENVADLKIEDMIASYLTPERLSGENQYECERCGGKQDAERSIQILESPKHLILTQLRFYYDTTRGQRQKVFTNVDFSEELLLPIKVSSPTNIDSASNHFDKSLQPSCSQITMEDEFKPMGMNHDRYALYGVVVHSGFSSEGGHYYCYARNSSMAGVPHDANDRLSDLCEWYNFNDERVTKTNFDNISRLTRTFTRDTAYLLFYKKMDSNEVALANDPVLEDLSLLRADLQEYLEKDNVAYKNEQESEFFRKRSNQRSNNSSAQSFKRDDFEDKPPPSGSCGGGPGFNITSREIF